MKPGMSEDLREPHSGALPVYRIPRQIHTEIAKNQGHRIHEEVEPQDSAALRLVFRPSRAVARSRPDFDRYWAGSLEATVPLRN